MLSAGVLTCLHRGPKALVVCAPKVEMVNS